MTADGDEKPYHVNLPWVEKYRPQNLDELISHDEIISTIKTFIDVGKLPHLLFYGPPGTGKTSTILACAKQLYAPKEFSSMVLELNASDDRGIGIVRGQILNFASTRTIFKSKYKLIILDEADAMTNDAQNALRRVIEKYTENVRFCIICNYLGKIIPALQSRCTRFRFGPLKTKQILPRLEHVIEQENLKVDDEGKQALIRLGEGDMRKVLNILQSTALAYTISVDPTTTDGNDSTILTSEHFYLCTGAPLPADIESIAKWMLTLDITSAFNRIYQLKTSKGIALADILTEVHKYLERIDFPPTVRIHLLKELAEIEYRLAIGTSEKLQLASLVSVFYTARNLVQENMDE
ncbi:Replication factor C subunit 5 [Orchesella cincta]|uniref:Replication factor C subunit 5 n=1 Tax=Orchesella cincta TaxID=48709 RepID=A0A1D2N901_ORCCI|nr:Replication factor C subunit 5 [Orchesella cincta]